MIMNYSMAIPVQNRSEFQAELNEQSPYANLKKGSEVELTIHSVAYGGQGIARWNELVVFVNGGIPGDHLRVQVIKKQSRYVEANITEIIKPSLKRIEPRCEYAGTCGGCKWQHFDYSEQLETKRKIVIDSFERIGNFDSPPVGETLASPSQYYYRNKMEFSFGSRRWLFPSEIASELKKSKDFALGLHVPGRYDRVLDLEACYLQSELSYQIVNKVREAVLKQRLRPYNVHSHEGYLRFLMIRDGKHTGEIMVNFVTAVDDPDKLKPIVDSLVTDFGQISSVVNNVNTSKSHVSRGEKEYILWGKSTIREKLKDYIFEISSNSFFQTNTYQAERLYDTIIEFGAFQGSERVYDLYSGAGSISLYISRFVKEVVGFENIPDAISNAKRNAILNGVKNCLFIEGDLKRTINEFAGSPDVVITDPPRAGMHPHVVRTLLTWKVPKLIYVSCNPTTQARDIRNLCEEGYHLEKLIPVDMFPHTYHIEVVALLVQK